MFIMLWKENGNRTWIKARSEEELLKYQEQHNLDDLKNEIETWELK